MGLRYADFQYLLEKVAHAGGPKVQDSGKRITSLLKALAKGCESLAKWHVKEAPGIVFVALNHRTSDGRREFFTWMTNRCVGGQWTNMLFNPVPEQDAKKLMAVVIAPDLAPSEKMRLTTAWKGIFSRYLTHTQELRTDNLTTWNQFLMSYATSPRAIGLIWGESGPAEDTPYLWYPHMGVSTAGPRNRNRLEKPSCEVDPCRLSKQNSTSQPTDLECRLCMFAERLEAMKICQLKPPSVYHLAKTMAEKLRDSYSIWGGTAFLSIPVILRPGETGVLSICTNRPLDEVERIGWHLIASHILGTLRTREVRTELDRTWTRASRAERHTQKVESELELMERANRTLAEATATFASQADTLKGLATNAEVGLRHMDALGYLGFRTKIDGICELGRELCALLAPVEMHTPSRVDANRRAAKVRRALRQEGDLNAAYQHVRHDLGKIEKVDQHKLNQLFRCWDGDDDEDSFQAWCQAKILSFWGRTESTWAIPAQWIPVLLGTQGGLADHALARPEDWFGVPMKMSDPAAVGGLVTALVTLSNESLLSVTCACVGEKAERIARLSTSHKPDVHKTLEELGDEWEQLHLGSIRARAGNLRKSIRTLRSARAIVAKPRIEGDSILSAIEIELDAVKTQ